MRHMLLCCLELLLQESVDHSVFYPNITGPLLSNNESFLPSVWLVVPKWPKFGHCITSSACATAYVYALSNLVILRLDNLIKWLYLSACRILNVTTYIVYITLTCVDVLVCHFLGFLVTSLLQRCTQKEEGLFTGVMRKALGDFPNIQPWPRDS